MGVRLTKPRRAVHFCDLPKWRLRRQLGVELGSLVTCEDCGQKWQWLHRGPLDLGAGWVPVIERRSANK